MKTAILGVAPAALALSLTACGNSPDTVAKPAPTVTVTARPTPSPTPVPTEAAVATTPAAPKWNLPKGFPKVVSVSSLPMQVKSWYEDDYTKAVAVAPGVWVPLSPGATMKDAIMAGTFDGFCGSIKSFERRYLDGEDYAGTCW